MWGRLTGGFPCQPYSGNTPTHVGKTDLESEGYDVQWKHPHACGEDPATVLLPDHLPETPPRMWGRRDIEDEMAQQGRNTPTHVGKTLQRLLMLKV